MTAYYNEFDPYAAQWLRNLIAAGHIADGVVDERSIEDVRPSDLKGFTQCHFFAGIGVWSYALRNAGWPDDRPVWTGSCVMGAIPNRTEAIQGARYRVCTWSNLYKKGAPVVGYGLEEKAPGARRYKPVAWKGKAMPWKTLAEARHAIAEINKQTGPQPQGEPKP